MAYVTNQETFLVCFFTFFCALHYQNILPCQLNAVILMISAICIMFGVLITCLLWIPDEDTRYMLYLVTAGDGLHNGFQMTTLNGMDILIFKIING